MGKGGVCEVRNKSFIAWRPSFLRIGTVGGPCNVCTFQSVFVQIFVEKVLYRGIVVLPLGMH
jgi:hypothetical protein